MPSFLSAQIANHLNLLRVSAEGRKMTFRVRFLPSHELRRGLLADAIEIKVRPRRRLANVTPEEQAKQAGKEIGESLHTALNSRDVVKVLERNGVPLTREQQKEGLFDILDEPSGDLRGRPIHRVLIVPDHVGWAEQIYRRYRKIAGPEIFARRASEALRRASRK